MVLVPCFANVTIIVFAVVCCYRNRAEAVVRGISLVPVVVLLSSMQCGVF